MAVRSFDRRRITAALLMALFLTVTSWSATITTSEHLDDPLQPEHAVVSNGATTDTAINSSAPNNNYGTDDMMLLAKSDMFDSRGLISFNMTDSGGIPMSSSLRIHYATLRIKCTQMTFLGTGRTVYYAATMNANWSESNATWNRASTGVNWSSPGASAEPADRGIWEPPKTSSSSGWISLNITRIAQQALRDNTSEVHLLLSALGIPTQCVTSESTTVADRPDLQVSYSSIGNLTRGSVYIATPADGSVVMEQGVLSLTADLSPAASWKDLNGSGVEIQFSADKSYQSVIDGGWHWTSWVDAAAFNLTTNGTFQTPSSTNLSEGTMVSMRMRSTLNDIIGDWEEVHFGLPDIDAVMEMDGSYTFNLTNDSLGLGKGTILDTFVTSGNTSFSGGSANNLYVGHSNDTNIWYAHMLLQVQLPDIGMHANATIIDAELTLRRTNRNGEAMISVSEFEKDEWTTADATWNSSGKGWNWTEGGVEYTGSSVGALNGNQSSPQLHYDLTTLFQQKLRSGMTDDLTLIVRGAGAAGEYATIGSSEEALEYQPRLTINYDWGDGTAPGAVDEILPRDGGAAWDRVEGNLTSTRTPTLSWNESAMSPADHIIIQLSGDDDFRSSVTLTADSRTDSGFALASGEYSVPASWNLQWGARYWWRIQWVEDGDRSDWQTQSMLVTGVNSTHLGNDEYRFSLRHGNGSAVLEIPFCKDTYLDSGNANGNENGNYLNVDSTQVALVSCELDGHMLPTGLAVIAATLWLRTDQYSASNNVAVTVHEGGQHGWTEDGATWNSFDGANTWSAGGASGTERVLALDSTTVAAADSWYEWNVTAAVQKAMRWQTDADFIITASGSATFYDRESSGPMDQNWPEIVIIYTQGSDQAPISPSGLSPDGGEWLVEDSLLMRGITRPLLEWTPDAVLSDASEIQMDTTMTLDSATLRNYQSWTDTSAFDLVNGTFIPPTDLTDGKVWYWRVRELSSTGQVGNWSAIAWFRVPNVISSMLVSDTSEVEMHHHGYLPSENHPVFHDTWVDRGAAGFNDTHGGASSLVVGRSNATDGPKDALIAIPLAENLTLPRPTGVNLVSAVLHLFVTGTNGTQPVLTAHKTHAFNESANGTTYDGVNNWSSLTGGQDVGRIVDIVEVTTTGWKQFIITEIVQQAFRDGDDFAYVQLRSDPNDVAQAEIASTEYSNSNSRPYITVALRNGTAVPPSGPTNLTGPANGEVTWNENGHVLEADRTPTLTWSHAAWNSSWDWRVFFWTDVDDELAGWTIYDSRTDAALFNLSAPSFTAPTLSVNQRFRWFVQPIFDSMLGERSGTRYFDVPYDLNWRTNSTDGTFEARRGSAVTATETYDLMDAGAIDSNSPTSIYSQLYVGRSTGSPQVGTRTHSLVRVDVGLIPIPEPWEVLDARIQLYKSSGSTNSLKVSVVPMLRDWNESNLTWNQFDTNVSWQTAGGTGSADIGALLDTATVSTQGWYEWNVTPAMQQARVRGDDSLSLMFLVLGDSPTTYHVFDNEMGTTNREQRPTLNVSYRIGTQWVPDDVTGHDPSNATTMWDATSIRPRPADPITLDWNHTASNASWHLEVSTDPKFVSDVTHLNSAAMTTGTVGAFGTSDFAFSNSTVWSDAWYHWRVRAVDGTRLGNWSEGGSFRVPAEIGGDDGLGNHTVLLKRGTVFVDSGLLPSFPDTYIDSATPFGVTRNHGSDTRVAVGNSPDTSGADAVALFDLDMGEMPFPLTILPTGVTLKLYLGAHDGTGTHSVSIHECFGNTWTESSVTWSSYNPATQCNSTASSTINRVASGGGVWYDWDITMLARDAFANNSGRMTIAVMSNWSGTLWFATAENQSSGYRPQLEMAYVDNPNGTTPPGQVRLVAPANLEALYDRNGMLLTSQLRPILSWQSVAGATGYTLRLKSGSDDPEVYENWNASTGTGFSANGTTWTPSSDLALQTLYTWDVQAITGAVPGVRSDPWSFAIADPTTSSLGNHVHQAYYQEGHDADVLAYPQVHDASIDESDPTATGGATSMRVGIGCGSGGANMDECRGIYMLDLGQLPLSSDANSHSAQLRIWLNQVLVADASYMDVSVHRLLNSVFDETGATWQSAAFGTAWNSSGMTAGVDYDSTALDTIRIYASASGGWLEFDVSGGLPVIDGSLGLVLIGTPNNGRMLIDLAHSEDIRPTAPGGGTSSSRRPILLFNYTTVDDIQISGPSTTDADTPVSFTAQMLDAQGGQLSGTVTWAASRGSIEQTGVYTPDEAGVAIISCRFGQVTRTINLTVNPGQPLTLVTTPATAGITTDQNVTLTAEVHDQFGNPVAGETIIWSATNGSFSITGTAGATGMTPITPFTWSPWLSGTHNITVTWDNESHLIPIVITVGTPDYLVITGCASIAAAENCTYTWEVRDWRGNIANPNLAATVTWSVDDGNISQQGLFVADHVGIHAINASSSIGIHGTFVVEVTHGAILEIELIANRTSITADDDISFSTVRIDIRGNRLSVVLDPADWTVSNGSMVAGQTPEWTPWTKGQQWVEASLEGVSSRVYITVSDGAPIALEARVRIGGVNVISGETRTVDGYAVDQRGNQRPVALQSWTILEPAAEAEWLEDYLTYAIFNARTEGTWTLRALYLWETADGTFSLHDDIHIHVTAGPLTDVEFDSVFWQVTADDDIIISVTTKDVNGNIVSSEGLEWWIHDTSISQPAADCGASSDSVRIQNGTVEGIFSQPASEIGEFIICAAENGYQARGTATITVGSSVAIWHESDDDTTIAGGILDIALWARDADGNEFRVTTTGWNGSEWIEGHEDGAYRYAGTVAGAYTLEYTDGRLTGEWQVTILASSLNRVELDLSKTTAEQLETVVLTAAGYDEFDNPVPVPNAQVMAIGHEVDPGAAAQTWNIRLIEVGSHRILVSSSGITAQVDVEVLGTVAGFFEAGGPVVYAGAAVIGLIMLCVIVLVIVIVRRGSGDGWDEDDFDEDDEGALPHGDSQTQPQATASAPMAVPSAGPMTGPTAGPAPGLAPGPGAAPMEPSYFEEPEEPAEVDGITVDDDGTEWWEDEQGIWWYRTPEMDDWDAYEE